MRCKARLAALDTCGADREAFFLPTERTYRRVCTDSAGQLEAEQDDSGRINSPAPEGDAESDVGYHDMSRSKLGLRPSVRNRPLSVQGRA